MAEWEVVPPQVGDKADHLGLVDQEDVGGGEVVGNDDRLSFHVVEGFLPLTDHAAEHAFDDCLHVATAFPQVVILDSREEFLEFLQSPAQGSLGVN